MKDYELKLKEFQALLGKSDEASEKRKDEIVAWLEENGNEDAKLACEEMIKCNLKRIDNEVATIRKQLGTKYDILPISYIAKHYFGKSVSWLHQRINGYSVRGRVYTLNDEQKKIFNEACQDIAKKIGSFKLA